MAESFPVYPKYFGLSEPSFSITPDPHYLFLSEQHREALAHLLYGAGENGGFVLLTGEVGTGKTTVCRAFLEQLPEGVEAALVLNPAMTGVELIASVCDEFGVELPRGKRTTKLLLDCLNTFLLDRHASGRRPVLVIDEAQSLRPDVLEQIRLLTNLETPKHKLLQIFLIGQPELRTLLATEQLRQLNQRITARFHLVPLTQPETAAYIRHRLSVAGVERPLFSRAAVRRIQRHSGGVPRLINLICDRALLGTAVSHRLQANSRIVDQAAREVRGREEPRRRPRRGLLAAAAAGLLAGGIGLWLGASGLLPLPNKGVDSPVAVQANETRPDLAASNPDPNPDPNPVPESVSEDAFSVVLDTGPGELAAHSDSKRDPFADAIGTDDGGVAQDDPPALAPAQPAAVPAAAGAQESTASVEGEVRLGEGLDAEQTRSASELPRVEPEAMPQRDQDRFPRFSSMPLPGIEQIAAPSLPKLLRSQSESLHRLLNLWDRTFPPQSPVSCAGAHALGLACERGEGRWNTLRRLDRPVALHLRLADGSEGDIVLLGLDDELARLDSGDGPTPVAVPISDLDQRWSGEYLLLWRLPPGGDPVIGRNAKPQAVRWLREQLRAWSGGYAALPDSDGFDQALITQVRAFQSSHELEVDGIAGPNTLIVLENVLDDQRRRGLSGGNED